VTAPQDDAALRVFTLRAPGEFPHLAHLRVARLYLQQMSLGEALDRYIADLKRFAAARGAAEKYHHTITVAFLLLVHARLAGAPDDESFEDFLARHPDLASPTCLRAVYSDAALASPAARRAFLFPTTGLRRSRTGRRSRPASGTGRYR
jgi:hypothetical protein